MMVDRTLGQPAQIVDNILDGRVLKALFHKQAAGNVKNQIDGFLRVLIPRHNWFTSFLHTYGMFMVSYRWYVCQVSIFFVPAHPSYLRPNFLPEYLPVNRMVLLKSHITSECQHLHLNPHHHHRIIKCPHSAAPIKGLA